MPTSLNDIHSRQFDVCIIGAGINGSSTAALLARKGYSVLLIDRNDFGSGSSSKSSRLLHCGLNQIGGIQNAKGIKNKLESIVAARLMMKERARLVALMPDRLKPATFYVPLRNGLPAKPWQFRAAFSMLDILGGMKVPLDYAYHNHRKVRMDSMLSEFGPDVTGAISFREYVFDWPERICIDYVNEAESHSAVVKNYTELVSANQTADGWLLNIRDRLDPDQEVKVEARLMLNLCGPWADFTNATLAEYAPRTLALTKGCHIAVKLPPAFRDKGIVTSSATGHLFICTPWRGFHIFGPTEQAFEGDPNDVRATDQDVEGILKNANDLFPRLNIKPSDVMWRYAGVRPATYEEGHPIGIWKKRIYDLTTSAASPVISLSWGRVVDHADTAELLFRAVEKHLGSANEHEKYCANQTFMAEDTPLTAYPRSIADILFRRTGRGWDADLGVENIENTARLLCSDDDRQPEPALIRDYLEMLKNRFDADTPEVHHHAARQ